MNCGFGTRIYNKDTCSISPDFICGKDCIIHSHVIIGPNVIWGNRVEAKILCSLRNVVAEDDVQFGIGTQIVTKKEEENSFKPTFFKKGSKTGKDVKIRAGITMGEYSRAGAGALVLEDVDAYTTVCGQPAEPHNKNHDHPDDHWGGKAGFI